MMAAQGGQTYVQVLANIRLNVAGVEHFLAIACSLADDNPSISEPVRAAAKAAHSSALLIEHLRSLFGHQEAIQAGLQQQQPLKPHLQGRPDAASPSRPSNGLKLGALSEAHEKNLNLFSYSNMRTLQRASKCLVANIAKILYLTDTVVLRSAAQADSAASADTKVSR